MDRLTWECQAYQCSGQMVCKPCKLTWDMNDGYPPQCAPERVISMVYLRPSSTPSGMEVVIVYGDGALDVHRLSTNQLRNFAVQSVDFLAKLVAGPQDPPPQ